MSSNEYFLAWSIYVGAAFFVIMFWLWLTSPFKTITIRLLLRFPVIAILLTPIPHAVDQSLYVPAVAAVAFDVIGKNHEQLSQDASVLIAAIVAALMLALVLGFLGRMIARLLSADSAR